jgi:hypothetical protein
MPPTQIDSVVIPYPIAGSYIIEVIPEADAPPGATYSMGVRIDGTGQPYYYYEDSGYNLHGKAVSLCANISETESTG